MLQIVKNIVSAQNTPVAFVFGQQSSRNMALLP